MANRYESQHWVSPPPRPTELVAEVEWVIAFECGDFGSGITDVLGALLARLATAEQERDEMWQARDETVFKLRAAEARVEALSAALAGYVGVYHRECHIGAHHEWDLRVTDAVRDRARAALACPPQQRGEK